MRSNQAELLPLIYKGTSAPLPIKTTVLRVPVNWVLDTKGLRQKPAKHRISTNVHRKITLIGEISIVIHGSSTDGSYASLTARENMPILSLVSAL